MSQPPIAARPGFAGPDDTLMSAMLARRTSLLVIDMQNDYCVPGGIISALGYDVSHFGGVAARLNEFLEASAEFLPHRIFVRTIAPSWPRSRALREHYARTALRREVDPTMSDWFGVAPSPDDPVVDKFRYSAFADTELDALLRANGTETLLVAGVTTDVCVDTTVRSAFMLDYGVIVLSDCTGASTIERHQHTLGVLDQFFAMCRDSQAVLSALSAEPLRGRAD